MTSKEALNYLYYCDDNDNEKAKKCYEILDKALKKLAKFEIRERLLERIEKEYLEELENEQE